jgi:sugar O-acyltransferase (sialic acid O-acetyltransferase NeuD family)
MIAYRMVEFGVERIEDGASTFIHEDPAHPAWREFQAWRGLGHQLEPDRPRPAFSPGPTALKKLWIIGAGGYGREVLSMTHSALGCGAEWSFAGFLNDVPDALDAFPDLPRIHADTNYAPLPGDVFICAIGDSTGRRQVAGKFKSRGANFLTLIHETACIAPSAVIEEGGIVEPYTGIGANSRIGPFTIILGHVIISHDVVIGEYSQVSPFACLLGRVTVGPGAFIASHAVILPDVKIGAGATVGAGSVVVKDVPDGATVFGVPARQIK